MENNNPLDNGAEPDFEAPAGSPIRIHQIAEEPREIGDFVVLPDGGLHFEGVQLIPENNAERPIVRIRRLDAEARALENPVQLGPAEVVVGRSEMITGRRRIIAGPGIDDSPEAVVEEMEVDEGNEEEEMSVAEQRIEPSTSSEQKNEPITNTG